MIPIIEACLDSNNSMHRFHQPLNISLTAWDSLLLQGKSVNINCKYI